MCPGPILKTLKPSLLLPSAGFLSLILRSSPPFGAFRMGGPPFLGRTTPLADPQQHQLTLLKLTLSLSPQRQRGRERESARNFEAPLAATCSEETMRSVCIGNHEECVYICMHGSEVWRVLHFTREGSGTGFGAVRRYDRLAAINVLRCLKISIASRTGSYIALCARPPRGQSS